MKVVYFFPAYNADFEDALENVKAAAPYFDYVVVIEDSNEHHAFTNGQRDELLLAGARINNIAQNVVIKQFPFEDDHPKMYQHGVDAALELGADWLAFGDCDEHFCEDFMKDVHKICEDIEKQGVTMAGLKCHAQFSIAEGVWPSSLSVDARPEGWMELEKVTEKVVVTNDHKYMLMKCWPDLKWSGVGRTGTVHTKWDSASHPWKAAFLPDQYWYLHRKTPLQVFKSAARNMFISGGGANLGDINKMWVELKEMMDYRGIKTWPGLERFVETKGHLLPIDNADDDDLYQWIVKALTWKATDYGTETRQTALWMIYHWQELLGQESVLFGVNHPPQLTLEDKVERSVQACYVEVLGRWPDAEGLDHYKSEILSGRIREDQLPGLLRESAEYRDRRTLLDTEEKHVQLPIDIKVTLNEAIMTKILMESSTYRDKLKPRIDVGRFVEEQLGTGFYEEFYDLRNKGQLDLAGFIGIVRKGLKEGHA